MTTSVFNLRSAFVRSASLSAIVMLTLLTGDSAPSSKAANPYRDWNDGDFQGFNLLFQKTTPALKDYEGRKLVFPNDLLDYAAHRPDGPFAAEFSRDYGRIQMSNNCYSFAVNNPQGHHHFAKMAPGAAAGILFAQGRTGDGTYVAMLAEADGLKRLHAYEAPPAGTYRVALVIAPNKDFHWYRENADGTWYHKMGHAAVTNRDASGRIITDPRRADRDYSGQNSHNYSVFKGFFAVPQAGINLNRPLTKLGPYSP